MLWSARCAGPALLLWLRLRLRLWLLLLLLLLLMLLMRLLKLLILLGGCLHSPVEVPVEEVVRLHVTRRRHSSAC